MTYRTGIILWLSLAVAPQGMAQSPAETNAVDTAASGAEAVELVVYAHSIDFGAKGYGNLVELAFLQETVAAALGRRLGRLVFLVKSAHVYESEFAYMRKVLDSSD